MNLSHLETSALRDAISNDNPAIRAAIEEFRETLDEIALQEALRKIARNVMIDGEAGNGTDSSAAGNSLLTSQSARDRVFPILISELVKENILSLDVGDAILKQFAMGNPVIGAALDVYDRDNDMGQLVDTLQEFAEVLKN